LEGGKALLFKQVDRNKVFTKDRYRILIEGELTLKIKICNVNERFNNIVQGNYFTREYSISRDLLGGPLYLN